jgi:polar amino acid transport system substrate-binding protein
MRKSARLFSVVITYGLFFFSSQGYSKEVLVGFEPFPPLVNEDGSGMVVNMLRAISSDKNLHFNFHIMTYGRAKKDLQSNKLRLIGLTPYQLETDEFYEYGVELNWHINTHVDFYVLDRSYFDIKKLPSRSIGTLIGNAEFFSEIVNVPEKKFIEVSSLEQLVKMLALGRLKVILFERVSTMSTIKSLNIKDIFYQEMGIVPASLAVSNTTEGLVLKQKLDSLLSDVKNEDFFSEFIHYSPSKDSGTVIIE